MACIIKLPSNSSKGVVSFTTQERDHAIRKSAEVTRQIQQLKSRWVIGLHHNWHDFQFQYDSLYDFSFAGEGDLIEKNGKPFTIMNMDACNFVPDCYRAGGDKFWDILYVARAVFFKKIPEFFTCIRELFDQGHKLRTLFICTVPPYSFRSRKTSFYNVRDLYDSMFEESEKDYFNLLTIDYRYPFPFDLATLSHFYRSSKIFVHLADDERRCRVAAYAFASGIPLVGMPCVGSLLPKDLQREPFYYEVNRFQEFPASILRALQQCDQKTDFSPVRKLFVNEFTTRALQEKLAASFLGTTGRQNDRWFLEGLDIRLGRHMSVGYGGSAIPIRLSSFVELLSSEERLNQMTAAAAPDVELAILKELNKNLPRKDSGLNLKDLFRRSIGWAARSGR